jgi:hypothetical protein
MRQALSEMTHPSAIAFMVLWFLFVLVNALSFYRTHVKKKFTSSIPLVGGLFGLLGFVQIPQLRNWCWVAVLVDYGSIAFLLALPKVVRELWQTSSINLVDEFVGRDGGKEVKIKLYKAGVFIIKHRITRRQDQPGLVESSDIGSWRETEGAIILTLRSDPVGLRQHGESWKVDRSFSHYGNDSDMEIQHIDFEGTR